MDDLTPDDDPILERLAAAGTVLDQLTLEATQPSPEVAPGRHRRHAPNGRSRPHRGVSGGGHRTLVALLAVLAVACVAVAAIVLSGTDRNEVVRADAPTTVLSDAALAGLVAERIDGVAACGPAPLVADAPEVPNGWQRVSGFDCTEGFIDEFTDGATLVPVYAAPEVGEPIARWSADAGWIPLDDLANPRFDFDRYRAAYRAELEARLANGPGN